MTVKVEHFTKEFFDEKVAQGALFMRERWLTQLPLDWIDCVMWVATQGMAEEPSYLIQIDSPLTEKVMEKLAKDTLEVYVLSEQQSKIWQLGLMKHENSDTGEQERIFFGGENLRQFCDDKDIYYRSMIATNGSLLSVTDMLYQKNPGEDCREPAIDKSAQQ